MVRRLGVTSTRRGLTEAQARVFRARVMLYRAEIHHGDCVNGDEALHNIALAAECRIVIHPPNVESLRANCQGADEVRPPRPYLVRNVNIVDGGEDGLLAFPWNEIGEIWRSGTWSTVRYARKKRRPIAIIRPSGRVETEEGRRQP